MVLPYLKGFLYISYVHCYGEWFWCLFLLLSQYICRYGISVQHTISPLSLPYIYPSLILTF
jgi:hypothetical protein